ncbi:MAG: NAD(P)H-quinone oxidoreductase [Gammaproteobacteria bacterium]|nr:NAD(P)H-quinone oxidoreductase [Gammaproteobacteria bacterium]
MNTLPATMQAVAITAPGGPEVLVPCTLPRPAPSAGEVLIRVHAAGVNRPDCLQRAGLYPVPPGASPLPGLEVAGEVVALGAGAERWQPGDRVVALTHGGGYAEYCVATASHCLPWPDGWSAVEAAGLPETCFTVYHNLVERGRLAAAETALVHGGSSGIGSTAIQVARGLGAAVVVTAGSAEKCAYCLELGASHAIDYRVEDWEARVRELTGGRGVDVVLDMVGGAYIAQNVRLLADDGRYVFIAFLKGPKAEVNFTPVLLKRLTITGSTLRPQSVAAKAAIARGVEERLWPLIADGKLVSRVHATFPLAAAAEAHAVMEAGTHMGKLVLSVVD